MNNQDYARVRATLMDVIDGGCTCGTGAFHPWELHDTDEIIANQQRLRFADRVAEKVKELERVGLP